MHTKAQHIIVLSLTSACLAIASEGKGYGNKGGSEEPTGTCIVPRGSSIAPKGTSIVPTGTSIVPGGTSIILEGTSIVTEGSNIVPEGSSIVPTFVDKLPSGSLVQKYVLLHISNTLHFLYNLPLPDI